MLIREAIQRVQSGYSKGVQSDDTRLSSRHIYSKLLTIRSTILIQKLNKRQAVSEWSYQVLPCVELVKVPIHQCPCIPPNGCFIYRTKYEFPEIITDINGKGLKSITSLDGSVVYDISTWDEVKNLKGNKYTSNKPRYFVKDKYIYFLDSKPRVVTILGLFQDPLQADNYPSFCDGEEITNCTSYVDRDFRIDNSIAEVVIETTINELIEKFLKVKEDATNNARDDQKKDVK